MSALIALHDARINGMRAQDPDHDRTRAWLREMGYTPDDFARLCKWGLFQGAGGCPYRHKQHATAITHLSIVIANAGVSRNRDIRRLHLCQMMIRQLPHSEGPLPCHQITLLVTPKESRGQERGIFAIPSWDVESCVFFAIGLMLFV